MFDFSKARKSSQKVENNMALSDFLNGYTSVSLFTMFFMLTLGSTRKSCVAQKTVLSTKEIFHIEVNVAQQNYVSHKNML